MEYIEFTYMVIDADKQLFATNDILIAKIIFRDQGISPYLYLIWA